MHTLDVFEKGRKKALLTVIVTSNLASAVFCAHCCTVGGVNLACHVHLRHRVYLLYHNHRIAYCSSKFSRRVLSSLLIVFVMLDASLFTEPATSVDGLTVSIVDALNEQEMVKFTVQTKVSSNITSFLSSTDEISIALSLPF